MGSLTAKPEEPRNIAPTVGPITGHLDTIATNMAIHTNAIFTDPGIADMHTAMWDWGDGKTSSGIVSETNGSGSINGRRYLVYSFVMLRGGVLR
jgi:hypothetical protein